MSGSPGEVRAYPVPCGIHATRRLCTVLDIYPDGYYTWKRNPLIVNKQCNGQRCWACLRACSKSSREVCCIQKTCQTRRKLQTDCLPGEQFACAGRLFEGATRWGRRPNRTRRCCARYQGHPHGCLTHASADTAFALCASCGEILNRL